MDIRLALMTGQPVPIPECQLNVHQPTLEEIAFIGEEDFFKGVQTLTLYKSMFIQDKSVLDTISNFQIFMMVMGDKTTADKKIAVKQIINLIFPDYKFVLTPQSLLFTDKQGESHIVDNNNFEAFQETLRRVFCSQEGPMDQQAFNPANAKAKEIADKLMRGRERVAASKGATNSSVFSRYLSILSVALHIPLTMLSKYTMFQLYDEFERYILNMNWELDVRTRLAGGKPDSQPENWMKEIH